MHGKTHLAVTTQAEPLPTTDTVDARQARRAGCGKDCGSEASRSECLSTGFDSSLRGKHLHRYITEFEGRHNRRPLDTAEQKRIDRRLSGLAGPDYDATISFGLPFESEDCQYGESRLDWFGTRADPRGRGTAEQWIKEGKYALNWTRLSCHRFMANRVRLSLFILAYNLGNFLRRLCLPKAVRHWSLRSVQVKLIKMGGRLVRHSRRLTGLAGPEYHAIISWATH